LYYDPEGAMKDWSDDELLFAVAHETGHCAFGHLWRKESRDFMRWNFATDFAINDLLNKEGFTAPKMCLLDPKFSDMSAEYIYTQLPENNTTTVYVSLDDPDIWKEVTEGKQPGQGKGEDGEDEEDGQDGGTPGKDDKDGKGQGKNNPQKSEQYWKDIVVSAANNAKMQGKLPAHLDHLIKDLLAPKLDWRELLRDYINASIKNNYRLFPSSKRFLHIPLYMPGLYGEHVELAIALDTSGSISDSIAQMFISEMKGITEQFESYSIHYMQCDAMVHSYQELTIDDVDDWPMSVKGRGGTSFIPVFDKIDELGLQPPILVYLTDLMGSFPPTPPGYQVLWVSIHDGPIPFGDKIIIHEDY